MREWAGIDSRGRASMHWGGKRHRVKIPDPELVAALRGLCAMSRDREVRERVERRAQIAELANVEHQVAALEARTHAAVAAELGALGYRLHKGEWRARRGRD